MTEPDFYVEDEPIEVIEAAFAAGRRGVTARPAAPSLADMIGQDVVVTNPTYGIVMARGRLIGLANHPTLIVEQYDGAGQITLPQSFRVEHDLASQARKVIAELERYEDEHGQHADGWLCLSNALTAARAAVQS